MAKPSGTKWEDVVETAEAADGPETVAGLKKELEALQRTFAAMILSAGGLMTVNGKDIAEIMGSDFEVERVPHLTKDEVTYRIRVKKPFGTKATAAEITTQIDELLNKYGHTTTGGSGGGGVFTTGGGIGGSSSGNATYTVIP